MTTNELNKYIEDNGYAECRHALRKMLADKLGCKVDKRICELTKAQLVAELADDNVKDDGGKYVVIWHEVQNDGGVEMGVFSNAYKDEETAREAIFSAITEDMNYADEEEGEFTIDFSRKPVYIVKMFGKVVHYKVEGINA